MKHPRGFSLIEMAFVLVIITLLLGGLLVPFATQVEQRRIAETQKAMDEIKEALTGFAIANGRLPCPAMSATDGREQTPPCTNHVGLLAWGALGVSKLDAWGHLYRYAVSPGFSDGPITFASTTLLTIQTRDNLGNLIPLSNVGAIPAVIISLGKNGYGGTNDDGSPAAAVPAANADEAVNANAVSNAKNFIARTLTPPGAQLSEFDDLVVWLSPNILFNRMVAAGKLP